MNYLSYLQEKLPSATITEEVNYAYEGTGLTIQIKYLIGQNYKESIWQPIQLTVYTDDLPTTKALLDSFTKVYNNTVMDDDSLDYVMQFYTTPMLLQAMNPMGNNFTSQYIISGTLIISQNISEIKTVKIDGYEYETSTRIINYITKPNNQRVSGSYINASTIENAMIKFTCSMINKNNAVCVKARRVRKGLLDINTPFTIALTFSDNDEVETYTMKLDNMSLNSENQTLPSITLSFIQ